ncbi:MAG: hypothetical protein HRU13_13000 [Phycisphaerales bacterium]|nr:hypothetical protein [Phycisphaerales bacterium]
MDINTTADVLTGNCNTSATGTRTRLYTIYEIPDVVNSLDPCGFTIINSGLVSSTNLLEATVVYTPGGIPRWEYTVTNEIYNYVYDSDGHAILDSVDTSSFDSGSTFGGEDAHWDPIDTSIYTNATANGTKVYTGGVNQYSIISSGTNTINEPGSVGGYPGILNPPVPFEYSETRSRTDIFSSPFYGMWKATFSGITPYINLYWMGFEESTVDQSIDKYVEGLISIDDITSVNVAQNKMETDNMLLRPTSTSCHNHFNGFFSCNKGKPRQPEPL